VLVRGLVRALVRWLVRWLVHGVDAALVGLMLRAMEGGR
jgi:hypothetical protein